MHISTQHLKKFAILFLFFFSIFLVGIKVDQGTYKVKYVIESNDAFVVTLLKSYLSHQEYRSANEGNVLEVYPLKNDDSEFRKTLSLFKNEMVVITDSINDLWSRSKQLGQATSEDLSCGDVVKCVVNKSLLKSNDPSFNEMHGKTIKHLKYSKYLNDLTLENWTILRAIDKSQLDFQFKTVPIDNPNFILKKTLLAFLASSVLSLLILLIRIKKEF